MPRHQLDDEYEVVWDGRRAGPYRGLLESPELAHTTRPPPIRQATRRPRAGCVMACCLEVIERATIKRRLVTSREIAKAIGEPKIERVKVAVHELLRRGLVEPFPETEANGNVTFRYEATDPCPPILPRSVERYDSET